MAKKKFKAKPFKNWLDRVAATVVKTRDGYTCQIVSDGGCAGTMMPGDQNCQCCHIISRSCNNTRWDLLNLITGCAHCHAWAHKYPVQFGVWFAQKYPHRIEYLDIVSRVKSKTWKEDDFRAWEHRLFLKAIDLNVDYLRISPNYRSRFNRVLKETL